MVGRLSWSKVIGNRVVVLGSTGIGKMAAAEQLLAFRKSLQRQSNPEVVDFERTFVMPQVRGVYDYLDSTDSQQRTYWKAAWSNFSDWLPSVGAADIVVLLHGMLIRPNYAARSPVSLDALRAFRPSSVVTLIDDVFSVAARTEARAGDKVYKGKPTVLEHLEARRAESIFGDILASHCSTSGVLKNFTLAVNHPARVLDRLAFPVERAVTCYLSFPISGPRQMAQAGDLGGIDEVNAFLRRSSAFERSSRKVVFFCPLSIDELPLKSFVTSNATVTDDTSVEFNWQAARWDLSAFWKEEDFVLSAKDVPAGSSITFPMKYFRDAVGMLDADVKVRDYRLVAQSHVLAVFNPVFHDRRSSGVTNEIEYAIQHHVPVHIFQDPSHDQHNQVKRWSEPAGPLGVVPGAQYVTSHASIDSMFDAIANHHS